MSRGSKSLSGAISLANVSRSISPVSYLWMSADAAGGVAFERSPRPAGTVTPATRQACGQSSQMRSSTRPMSKQTSWTPWDMDPSISGKMDELLFRLPLAQVVDPALTRWRPFHQLAGLEEQ